MTVHVSFYRVGYSLKIKHIEKLKKTILSPFHGRNRKYCSSGDNYSIHQNPALQNKFKNWQHLRRNKLTASTFGRAVGFWRHGRVELWREKVGLIEPFSGNLATVWGNIKEEEAINRYELITENKLQHPNFSVNLQDEWLAASADGIVNNFIYGLPSRGIVEIKCPYFNGDKEKSIPWKRIPMYYIPQAQGLMEILDRDWMDIYCWTINGSSLFRMHRDVEYWGLLKIALSDFWWRHVQPAKELYNKSVITDPPAELASLMPAPKHELHRDIVYLSKLVSNNSHLLMREIHGSSVEQSKQQLVHYEQPAKVDRSSMRRHNSALLRECIRASIVEEQHKKGDSGSPSLIAIACPVLFSPQKELVIVGYIWFPV